MVKHIVFWNIQDGLDKEVVMRSLKEKLESLPAQIEVLKKVEVGFNYNASPAAFEVSLYSEFDTKEDLEAYIVHPAHQEVGTYVKSVVKDRAVVDYEV